MPLDQPSPSNGYLISPFHKLSVELWNLILTSLHGRLTGLEAVAGSFEDALGSAAVALAQGRIDDTIVPQLLQVQAEMTAVQAAIAVAEDQLAALQNGGVLAANVPLAGATPLFPGGTDAQEAFGIVELALNALASGKLAVSAKADAATAKAGVSDTAWLTPFGAAALIGEIAGDVVKEVFPTSGLFTKGADDLLYYVELWSGAGSGHAVRQPAALRYIGGGDGGDYISGFILPSQIGATVAVTVGAGGAPVVSSVANANMDGNNGGDSSFGTLLKALGGRGGKYGSQTVGTDRDLRGGKGSWGSSYAPGSSVFGGGAGAGADANTGSTNVSSTVGTSQVAGSGGASGTPTGTAGTVPAGGGGAACTATAVNATSGAGARGEGRVWRIKRRKAA